MQSQSIYRNIQPTSLQPQASSPAWGVAGWGAQDRVVFVTNLSSQEESRASSIRLNGVLNLSKIEAGVYKPLAATDVFNLDSLVGANGFIKSIITEIDVGSGFQTVEMIQEYARYVKIFNQSCYMEGSMMGMNDALQEYMSGSNDQFAGVDFKALIPLGMKFKTTGEVTSGSDKASQLPFSIDLKACFNTSTLPGDKIKAIQISIIWQDAFKTGAQCFTNDGAIAFDYKVSNCEIRHLVDPLQYKGDIVLKVVDNCSTPYILNKYSGLTFQTAKSAHAVYASFLRNDHNSTSSSLKWNYLETEALPKIASLELKVNGQNDSWQYPLTQTNQILSNYLLAVHEGETPANHSLTYAKLSNPNPSGFGIGASLTREYPSNTTITFNIVLSDALGTDISNNPISYKVFFYSVGFLKL